MILIGFVGAVLIWSCTGEEDLERTDEQHAIAFASVSEEQNAVTRAASSLAHSFVVYGYKNVSGNAQTVFDGYTVAYLSGSANTSEDNTHGYYYVGGAQSIKYWDFSATEYNFWGYTGNKDCFTTDGTKLTIDGLALSATEPADINQKLFSRRYHRHPVANDVVQLQFLCPYAKVRVMFYTTEELTGDDEIQLTDITFDGGANSIATTGKMEVNYKTIGAEEETVTMTATAHTDNLTFGNATLDATHGTTSNNAVVAVPTAGTEWYYALPVSDASAVGPFTLRMNIDDDPKTAVVPANFMQWQPNTSYTYIFKITEAGKKIEVFDVKIEPWKYGGSQEEEWKNW